MNEPTRKDPATEEEQRRSVDKNSEEAFQPAADPQFEDVTGAGAGSDVRKDSGAEDAQ
jgi:hypothetical protein